MRIFVKTKVFAKKQAVLKLDDVHYVVSVREAPAEGRANEAVIRALADYFGTRKSNVRIVSGESSRHKLIEIT
jgi:uncharacterized protein (TIGR00251 family)